MSLVDICSQDLVWRLRVEHGFTRQVDSYPLTLSKTSRLTGDIALSAQPRRGRIPSISISAPHNVDQEGTRGFGRFLQLL